MKKKRFFGILLSIALILSLIPAMSLTAYAVTGISDTVEYPLWVGGVQVTSANEADVFGDGKVSYTPATTGDNATPATLTLNNYSYTGEGYTVTDESLTIHYAVLYDAQEPLNIVLSGENSLACVGTEDDVYFGIRSNGNLTISGTGSASVNGKSTGIIIGSIIAPANLDIAGGSVTIRQTDGNAFEVYGGMRIGEGAGTIVAETTDPYERGVYVFGSDGLVVNGGSLTASGGKAGIKAQNGPVVIGNNCTVVATGDTCGIEGTVKNAIAGTGWTDVAGTTGKADIAVSEAGQTLEDYKKVQFPAVVKYPLWVGGIQVTEENAANITDGETVTASYDAENNTLTLNNYSYSGEGYSYYDGDIELNLHSAIQYDGTNTLTISLQGKNSITCTGNAPEGTTIYYGIRSKSGVKIDGTGSIAVDAKDQGLFISTGDLEILGGSVTAKLEDGYPVEVHGNVVIGEKAQAVTFETSGKNATSVLILTGKDLVINGGTVRIASYGQGGKAVFAASVIIGENVTEFTAIGAKGAFIAETTEVKVKNAIEGTGWTDVEGTTGKADIAVSTTGQDLSSYKKVQFPEQEVWPFSDVKEEPGNWIYDAAKYVYDRGIMTGMGGTTLFNPAGVLSRGQFATILYRMSGADAEYKQVFPDVKESDWFGIPVAWCNATGVVTGYENGLFGPGDDITREQLATMLYRYAEYMGYDTSEKADFSKYPDAWAVSDWAKDAMEWAVGTGIIKGQLNGTWLDPQGKASRADCATMIMRFMEKYVEADTSGQKAYTLEVSDGIKTIWYSGKTDSEYLSGLLDELKQTGDFDYESTVGEYGLYIISVNGVRADDNLKTYWAIYVNDEYGQYGVDSQPVTDGDSYVLKLESYE